MGADPFDTAEEVGMIADVARIATTAANGVWGMDRVLDESYVEEWPSGDDGAADPEAPFLEQRVTGSAENSAMYKAKRRRGQGPACRWPHRLRRALPAPKTRARCRG